MTTRRCGKRKHTPIRSRVQQGKFGAELRRRRSGEAPRMAITTADLVSHLKESAGKKLPRRVRKRRKR